jgi:hypothetical protein
MPLKNELFEIGFSQNFCFNFISQVIRFWDCIKDAEELLIFPYS